MDPFETPSRIHPAPCTPVFVPHGFWCQAVSSGRTEEGCLFCWLTNIISMCTPGYLRRCRIKWLSFFYSKSNHRDVAKPEHSHFKDSYKSRGIWNVCLTLLGLRSQIPERPSGFPFLSWNPALEHITDGPILSARSQSRLLFVFLRLGGTCQTDLL